MLYRWEPDCESFTVLGVVWDLQLKMDIECEEVAGRADNKLTSLLRLRRFYDLPSLVRLYKAQVLPMLEFPTPAIYHASNTCLAKLDKDFLQKSAKCMKRQIVEQRFKLVNAVTRRSLQCSPLASS